MKGPTKPGFYWLALDDGCRFEPEHPILCKVGPYPLTDISEGIYVEFLSGYKGSVEAETFTQLKSGSVRRIAWEVAAVYTISSRTEELRLHWLGEARLPKMPHEDKARAEDEA